MKRLTVLYDASCGLCRRARAWLAAQPALVPLEFLPAGGEAARARYPNLDHERTLREMTAISDDGRLWRGDGAWIMCLWALQDHRSQAMRFSGPLLRPLARRFVNRVSAHRHQISSALWGNEPATE